MTRPTEMMDDDTELTVHEYVRWVTRQLHRELREHPDEVQTKRTFDERIQQRMRDLPAQARPRPQSQRRNPRGNRR